MSPPWPASRTRGTETQDIASLQERSAPALAIGLVSQNRQYQDRSIRLRWPAGIDALSVMGKP